MDPILVQAAVRKRPSQKAALFLHVPELQEYLQRFLDDGEGSDPSTSQGALTGARDFLALATGHDIGKQGCAELARGVVSSAKKMASLSMADLQRVIAQLSELGRRQAECRGGRRGGEADGCFAGGTPVVNL